ncbi:MAG TPA: hypothetical protein DCQ99_02995 [Nitrospinae bacterium]|nr:hypothetical protein [Nitrospinota bacterium]HBA26188.1 hypothetical protein [Nitrospinota bacterium]
MKSINNKKRILIILAVLIAVILTAFLLASKGKERAIKKSLDTYINAIVNKDFDTIFKYHAHSQRRIAVTTKYPETMEAQIKEIYKEQKDLYEEAKLMDNIKEFWSEKFLMVKDMKYRINKIEMVRDIENPTSPIRERIDALMEVEVEYTNIDMAPNFHERIKSVIYLVRMVHSKNVIRSSFEEMGGKRWLFKSIDIKEGSLKYW